MPVSLATGKALAVRPFRSIAFAVPAVVPSNGRTSRRPSRQARYRCPESMKAPRMSADASPAPVTGVGAPAVVPSNDRFTDVSPPPTVYSSPGSAPDTRAGTVLAPGAGGEGGLGRVGECAEVRGA